jgi:hypothetical protein
MPVAPDVGTVGPTKKGIIHAAERCINRLKQWRGLTTRYETRALNYRAMLVHSIVLWLKSQCVRQPPKAY